MPKKFPTVSAAKFRRSRKALAIPVTFMILFVTTLTLISVTYYLAVEKVNAKSQDLKITTAKQDFLTLDDDVLAVAWQPGSARTINIGDSGGQLKTEPTANLLTISVSDNRQINQTVYNETVGQVTYQLPSSESADTGLFLKGDSRTIVGQSSSVVTQLSIESGIEAPEIQLQYRPTVLYATEGTENGQAVNEVRIYVLNMNGSDPIALYGEVPLRISSESTRVTSTEYSVAYSPQTLSVTANLNGVEGQISIPISSTANGAIVNLEVVECNITIARSLA